MFLASRPSLEAIERFVRDSKELPLSHQPIGADGSECERQRLDEAAVTIGRGREDFERARAALRSWKHFDIGWAELHPCNASCEVGTIVAVLIRHLGFWSLNGCRVVYGEELFEVSLDRETDDVTYRIRAISWPRAALARLGYPVTRALQARFRRDSAAAMKRAVRTVGYT